MKLTKNFSRSEFDCSCGCDMPKEVLNNVQKVANQLQALRNIVGKSITVNSGYRCPEYNTKARGVKTSQHILGKASDITIKDMTPDDVAHLIEQMIDNGDMLQGGLGRYNTFTHYDIRKTKARWNFKN
jgi:uncharacterized protein YcbK (DUF882 family)